MKFLNDAAELYGPGYLSELRRILTDYAPQASRFLEWGSGAATRLICDVAATRSAPFVLSIDHDREYLLKVADDLPQHPFLHLRHLDLQGPSWSQTDQYPSYSSYPYFLRTEFDVAYVDGRRRSECALVASQIVHQGGIVILHDWRRSRYAPLRALFDTIEEGAQFLVLKPKQTSASTQKRVSETRVVLTVARGVRASREIAITSPLMRSYAGRIGADFFIVGEDSTLPRQRLKYEARKIAKQYDRALLLDADVLIRANAPDLFDIVPRGSLGAFPEGAFFPREEWSQRVSQLYGLKTPLESRSYFNSGVMVFCPETLALLETLNDDVVFGHPNFEQGLLNARRESLRIPLFPLSSDLNFIPNPDVFATDWRHAFFYHAAGFGKNNVLYRDLYEDRTGDRKTFSSRRLRSEDVRPGALRQVSEQIQGHSVRIFDATDFQYFEPYAMPIFNENGEVIAYIPENVDHANAFAIYGPYAKVEAGQWLARFESHEGETLAFAGAEFDVVQDLGETEILPRQAWPEDGQIEFSLERPSNDLEIRIYRSAERAEFAYLKLYRLGGYTQVGTT